MNSAPVVFFDITGPDAAKLKEFHAASFGRMIDDKPGITTSKLNSTLRRNPAKNTIYFGAPNSDDAMKKVFPRRAAQPRQ